MGVYNKHFKFLQRLQQYLGQSPVIQSQDIEYFLNRGQDLWVDTVYEKFNGKEELRRRLNSIIVVTNLTASTGVTGVHGGEIWEFPDDAKYILEEFVKFSSTGDEQVPVKPMGFGSKQINNPFKRPSSKLVWRIDEGRNGVKDKVELIKGNSLPITNYIIIYVKVPDRINIHLTPQEDTDISEYWEDEIVELAVKVALESYRLVGAFSPSTAKVVNEKEENSNLNK